MFFFFKQKTAYEFEYGLVGSGMCIRDSSLRNKKKYVKRRRGEGKCVGVQGRPLYTSVAADEEERVDLGARWTMKKKKIYNH